MNFATLTNISLAMLLGAVIGFERQWNQGMAGLRTNTLVAFGSACFVTIGAHAGDTRVAAQIVSGIGFLGAGVILHEGPTVRGLNTAATLWCAAAVGSLCASGLRMEAAYAAIGVALLNIGLQRIQVMVNRYVPHPSDVEVTYSIETACTPKAADEIGELLGGRLSASGFELKGQHRETLAGDGADSTHLVVEASRHGRADDEIGKIIDQIGKRPDVATARWSVTTAGMPATSGSLMAPRRAK